MGFYIGNLTSDWLPEFITAETLSRHTIYGVTFDGATHRGTRLYDAEGKNWSPSSTSIIGADHFRDLKPFKFKKCLMSPGTNGNKCSINSYYDNLGLTPSAYNQKAVDEGLDRFIEYDVYYYSRPNKWTWLISPDYIDGFLPCPACDRGENILSKWYMGEYAPNDSYRMLNGQYPKVNITNADARTALRAKGYRLSDYANYISVVMLALVKYADLNFQNCLGMGWYSGNSRQISSSDGILGDDGYNGANKDDNASIKVMGITDLYGNVWKHNDAIFEYGGYLYTNDDLDNITEWPTMSTWEAMGYKKSNVVIGLGPGKKIGGGTTTPYITNIAYDSQYPYMVYPTEFAGSKASPSGYDINPIGDGVWYNNDNIMRCVVLGGSWTGSLGGAFCWYSGYDLLCTGVNFGCLASAFPAV